MPNVTFNKQGMEIPDQTPVAIPLAHKRPESLQDMIKRLVRTDVSRAAEQVGAETFEEANDFDDPESDAELFPTHHELHEEVVNEALRANREAAQRAANKGDPGDVQEPAQEEADEEGSDTPPARSGKLSKRAKQQDRARRSDGASRRRREDAEEEYSD